MSVRTSAIQARPAGRGHRRNWRDREAAARPQESTRAAAPLPHQDSGAIKEAVTELARARRHRSPATEGEHGRACSLRLSPRSTSEMVLVKGKDGTATRNRT